MVAPGGDEQEGLTNRIPSFTVAFEKEPPDCLATRRSSRFTRRPYRDPRALKRGYEKPYLGRLAGALPTFDRNEPAARRRFRLFGVQRRWPQTR
jgi:hypothetical protein